MDQNENTAESEVMPTSTAPIKPTVSTARRTVAATLVLVAALLLGYVLYGALM